MTLIVCGLEHVEALLAKRRPSHMITLLDPATMIDTPAGLAPDRHLRLGVNDIAEVIEGLTPPDETTVSRIVEFGRGWDDEAAPMLVHCWAGISRSTASAFVIACERNPDASERAIARALRAAAPHAFPNRRIVALADDMLGRGGRMVDAIDSIGGDGFTPMGRPFDLPARH